MKAALIIFKRQIIVILTFYLFTFSASNGQQSQSQNSSDEMRRFLEAMPKAELHLHLEGTLSPETIVQISNRNGLDYFNTVEEVKKSLADRPPGLMGFLQHHFKSQEVMQTREDFYSATYSFLKKLNENNVVYADIFFDPQAHTSRGISFEDIFEGINAGRIDGEKEFGIKVNLLISIQRERSVESAMEMLDDAKPYRDQIIAIAMDSGPEYGNPPTKFKDVYARARKEGYFLTGHHDVDVRDSVKHIWQSLDIIGMDRIDHGLNAVDDEKLIKTLVKRGICLTASPVKRTTDPGLQDVGRITKLFEKGVCVSIHTDDPEEFDSGYLNNMMIRFQKESGFSKTQMTGLMLNAYRTLWVSDQTKNTYIEHLKNYVSANDVNWAEVLSVQK